MTAAINQPGAQARLTFAGTAGQTVTVDLADATLPDECNVAALIAPDGSLLKYACLSNGGGTMSADLPDTGTYAVVVNPTDRHQGTVAVRVRQ